MSTSTTLRPRPRLGVGLPLLLAIGLGGCVAEKFGDLGELTATVGSTTTTTTTTGANTGASTDGTSAGTTGDTTMGSTTTATTESSDTECQVTAYCGDQDHDSIGDDEDNSKSVYNPDQVDSDEDGAGDASDFCPLLAGENLAYDSDKDGVGNPCDRCAAQPALYNEGFEGEVPEYLWVLPDPLNRDFDGDGIGDRCDNCIATPNCGDYDLDNPHELGDPIPEDPLLCQKPSDDQPLLGEACLGVQGEGAAGPVGFGPLDDLDQDGLANILDECPRDPVAERACVDYTDCPGSSCHSNGRCGHVDHDGDGVGDRCDTCPYSANAEQKTVAGRAMDDEDGDGIGAACEAGVDCAHIYDPRPVDFYQVSVGGACCVTLFQEGAFVDPDHRPLTVECDNEFLCRPLPVAVVSTPGVVYLPPGCEEALAELGMSPDENVRLTLDHPLIGGSTLALEAYACLLPPRDQDFDGLGDACDLCPYAFDPNNEPYIDEDQKLYPGSGKYCNGKYDPAYHCQCG